MKVMFRAIALLAAVFLTVSVKAAPARPDSLPSGMTSIVVPDSLAPLFQRVMAGKARVVAGGYISDPNEKVIVEGDTTNLIIRDKNIGRYNRGLFNYLFIPKKSWQFGVTASYGEFSSDDLQMFDLLDNFDFTGHTFSIKPYISYFIRNNFSIGMRIVYSNGRADLGALKMDFDEDLSLDISDVRYRSESLTAAIFARQYIGLSRNGRFGVFNELELSFASGNSDFRRNYDGVPKTTNTTYSDLRLNFSPGLCVFINDYVSFNIAFAVVGFYLKNEKQSVDGVYSGNRLTSGANFKFNIFNINFGLGIHL